MAPTWICAGMDKFLLDDFGHERSFSAKFPGRQTYASLHSKIYRFQLVNPHSDEKSLREFDGVVGAEIRVSFYDVDTNFPWTHLATFRGDGGKGIDPQVGTDKS